MVGQGLMLLVEDPVLCADDGGRQASHVAAAAAAHRYGRSPRPNYESNSVNRDPRSPTSGVKPSSAISSYNNMQELPHLNMFAQPPPIVMMALSTPQSPAAALGELENVAGPPHAASQPTSDRESSPVSALSTGVGHVINVQEGRSFMPIDCVDADSGRNRFSDDDGDRSPSESQKLSVENIDPSSELRACSRHEYAVLPDSGDSCYWFFQTNYSLRSTGNRHQSWREGELPEKKTLPAGDERHLKQSMPIAYADGGVAFLDWHDHNACAIPFEFPSWNWESGTVGITCLKLTRVLAREASEDIVNQPFDGNLGLAVPGWRSPWTEVGPEDRTTFFDVLNNGGEPRVANPWRVLFRLQYPRHQAKRGYGRSRSFLYFGNGEPCVTDHDNNVIPPRFGPRIPILPAPGFNGYNQWTLRLLSMTLLVPDMTKQGSDLDHSSHSAPDWPSVCIPTSDPAGDEPGVRVVFDTGAVFSYFPPQTITEMQEKWKIRLAQGVQDRDEFVNHDIASRFAGSDGGTSDFRCDADKFLVSPWKKREGGYVIPMYT